MSLGALATRRLQIDLGWHGRDRLRDAPDAGEERRHVQRSAPADRNARARLVAAEQTRPEIAELAPAQAVDGLDLAADRSEQAHSRTSSRRPNRIDIASSSAPPTRNPAGT